MKKSTKMFMMAGNGNNSEEMENRFRDRRGREHYDNGRFAPMSRAEGGRYELRNEFEDNGRNNQTNYRGGNGRSNQMYSEEEEDGEARMNYRGGNYRTNNREGGGKSRSNREGGGNARMNYRAESDGERRNEPRNDGIAIWNMEPTMGGEYWPRYPHVPPYGDRMDAIGFDREPMIGTTNHMGEESERRSMRNSYAAGNMKLTPEMAEEWTAAMVNEDGTKGPHWTQEQAKKVMSQRGIVYDPLSFWVILNAMYSDYCAIAKKHGVNTLDFYVDITKAWLGDKDAVDNKAAMYYECIVK